MKILNEKGRLFGKASIVDVLIIIFALLVIVVIIDKVPSLMQTSTGGGETKKVTFTVETESVPMNFIEQIKVGDKIYNSSKNYYMGEVVSVTSGPYKKIFENTEKGVFNNVEMPNEYVAFITIQGDAKIAGDNIMIDQEAIKVGAQLPVKGKGYAAFSYIIKIEGVE